MIMVLSACLPVTVGAQAKMMEMLDSAAIREQMDYIQQKTLIYENFRAIREDIFQKMKRNVLDTISDIKKDRTELNRLLFALNTQIDTLNSEKALLMEELDTAIKNKNTISFLGIPMNKILYNTLMWAIIIGLASLLVILFLLYKRNHSVTIQMRKDFEELKEEHERHKKQARERYEKLVVSHHHEIQQLKEGKASRQ